MICHLKAVQRVVNTALTQCVGNSGLLCCVSRQPKNASPIFTRLFVLLLPWSAPEGNHQTILRERSPVHPTIGESSESSQRWDGPELNQVESIALDLWGFILLYSTGETWFSPRFQASPDGWKPCAQVQWHHLPVWADVLIWRGSGSSSPGIYRKKTNKIKVRILFKKGKLKFIHSENNTDLPVSCIHFIGRLLTPLSPLQTQVHEYLIVPLPPHCMVRLISFIRAIRGLEGSQWRGSTVWHSSAMVTIQLAASIFAPPPHDLHQ